MVTITGAALTDFNRRKDGSSFRDWVHDAFQDALKMSSLDRSDIDLLVVSSESDFFTLQLNPSAVLASDLGLVGTATIRAEGGGASGQIAVHAAVNAIRAGQARHVAVVGYDPSASILSSKKIKELYGFSFDAWTDGMTGASSTVLYALSAQQFMAEHSLTDRHLAAVTIANRKNAFANLKAHLGLLHTEQEIDASPMIANPYRRLHCSPLSDGAAALIISESSAVPSYRATAPWIKGIGGASDHVRLGARQIKGQFSAKTIAMARACSDADLTPKDIGLVELYDAYAGAHLQGLAALGLSENIVKDIAENTFGANGRIPVNLSGGLMGQGAPAGAIGVGQTAGCALFLEGRHWSTLQPQSPPPYALADTHGGLCTTAAITILARRDAP